MSDTPRQIVYVSHGNHFDLLWRRGWQKHTHYLDKRYVGYAHLERTIVRHALALAEAGRGAYEIEQALTIRMLLEDDPSLLGRMRSLYEAGLFEVTGAGEAIIDVNMSTFESMIRNLASGTWYEKNVLGMEPRLAAHNDGFGSSAQFPQVIRGCGFPGIANMSYSTPDAPFWRGLDGSVVFYLKSLPGETIFFDHCYHEPCPACGGFGGGCTTCGETCIDLRQNVYPPFEPIHEAHPGEPLLQMRIRSEEMLAPEDSREMIERFNAQADDVEYRFGTGRLMDEVWEGLAARIDDPPAGQISSRVENNPTQSGTLVSRIRVKQLTRRAEESYYGWEKAAVLSGAAIDAEAWATRWREIPVLLFHDSITGTHQDQAYQELIETAEELLAGVEADGRAALGATPSGAAAAVFNSHSTRGAMRIELPAELAGQGPMVAVDEAGRRWPVVRSFHPMGPAMPKCWRPIESVGPDARFTRPAEPRCWIEARDLSPLAWTNMQLESAEAPANLDGPTFQNEHFALTADEHGLVEIRDLATNQTIAPERPIGELVLDHDEGDPWGTRWARQFRRPLRNNTHLLGAMRFEGYQEIYFGGRLDENLQFGREQDPNVFALDFYVTVRLLDHDWRIDFSYEVFWKSADRRLRALFPTGSASDAATYSIPGGYLDRDRYEQEEFCLFSPNGDWPTLYFVSPDPAGPARWAVVNYGTPACCVRDGAVEVSLLRSPGFGHCLERYAQTYPMPTSQIRDNGWHGFELSLLPWEADDVQGLAMEAAGLNRDHPLVPGHLAGAEAAVAIDASGVDLLAAKRPFDPDQADAVVLRLVNRSDQPSHATVNLAGLSPAEVWRCNLLEEVQDALAIDVGRVTLDLAPFQLATLLVTRGG